MSNQFVGALACLVLLFVGIGIGISVYPEIYPIVNQDTEVKTLQSYLLIQRGALLQRNVDNQLFAKVAEKCK